VGAIVVAAGRGTRFGGETPKQFLPIGGVPMVLRALRPFASHRDVRHIALVLPPDFAAQPPAFLNDLLASTPPSPRAAGDKLSPSSPSSCALTIVSGGTHRGDSVRAGIMALPVECTIVLVHDGARPFVDSRTIDAVIECARQGEAAVPAVPLSETLKEAVADDPTRISRTRPRERLWRAQTPQGFPRRVLEEAHARAARLGRRATDDSALVEAMGFPVRLVPGLSTNIKITTPEDFALAELLAGGTR
jgi:2-C-methyl-D-erythritol 4-phosphate cytidylyltransferase